MAHTRRLAPRALKDWGAAAGTTEWPISRSVTRHGRVRPARLSDRMAAREMQRTVIAAQAATIAAGNRALAQTFDPKRDARRSLRAGFITSAAVVGVPAPDIMRQSVHTREEMLPKHVRHATVSRQRLPAECSGEGGAVAALRSRREGAIIVT